MRLIHSLRAFQFGLALVGASFANSAFANPAILFDLATGKVLQHQEAFQRWYPASLTKLMTAYVTFRAVAAGELALTSPIEMTAHAAAEPPTKMGFKPGSIITLDNALKMMLIRSSNDIAMAVGENVGGSEDAFVQRMNAEAQRLGMTGSHWANPNGLFAIPTNTPLPATWRCLSRRSVPSSRSTLHISRSRGSRPARRR